jgi:hypothetical protein
MFSRFQIAGEALAIAALSASAVAQNPQAPINTLTDLEAALQACWVPPPMEQSRPGMQITVLMSFKRNGELFEQPRITISIEGGVLIGAPEVLRKPRFTCSRPAIHSTVIA